jgi:hypothetical protein
MVIFQLDELDQARERAAANGIRTVWQIDLPDISGTHLHPADTRGAIVSLDRADPPGSWRWGGPDWTGREGTGAPGRLLGATVAVEDPAAVAERWGRVLGVEPSGQKLRLDHDGSVRFAEAAGEEGLVEVSVAVPGRQDETIEIGGARFKIEEGHG